MKDRNSDVILIERNRREANGLARVIEAMSSAGLRVASATESNIPEILGLIRGLAQYEDLLGILSTTEDSLREMLFGPQPAAEVLLAFVEDECAGFALFFPTFCAMLGRRGLFLENIFVRPEWRAMGIGEALLGSLAVLAEERNCARIDWRCLDYNKPAIGFYESLSAVALAEWTPFRMDQAAIHQLSAKQKKRRCFQTYMKRPTECRVRIEIRRPRIQDIPPIVDLIHGCGPYLTSHSSYIPWIYTQFYFETCAVAELDGEIVGWCSIIPVPGGYFLHQLGVAPKARRNGIARSLLAHALQQLDLHENGFALQFTVDRRNSAVLDLNRSIAENLGMQVIKKTGVLPLIEDSEEELYMMAPLNAELSSNQMALDKWELMAGRT